jgi:hypothetical protein
MQRRNARLRREYLYRKGLEGKEKAVYEKKRKIKDALASENRHAHVRHARHNAHGTTPSAAATATLFPPHSLHHVTSQRQ